MGVVERSAPPINPEAASTVRPSLGRGGGADHVDTAGVENRAERSSSCKSGRTRQYGDLPGSGRRVVTVKGRLEIRFIKLGEARSAFWWSHSLPVF